MRLANSLWIADLRARVVATPWNPLRPVTSQLRWQRHSYYRHRMIYRRFGRLQARHPECQTVRPPPESSLCMCTFSHHWNRHFPPWLRLRPHLLLLKLPPPSCKSWGLSDTPNISVQGQFQVLGCLLSNIRLFVPLFLLKEGKEWGNPRDSKTPIRNPKRCKNYHQRSGIFSGNQLISCFQMVLKIFHLEIEPKMKRDYLWWCRYKSGMFLFSSSLNNSQ